MSEKWLLSRCEGYAVRIDESTANCSTERMTRLKRRRNDPHSTPRNAAQGDRKSDCSPKQKEISITLVLDGTLVTLSSRTK